MSKAHNSELLSKLKSSLSKPIEPQPVPEQISARAAAESSLAGVPTRAPKLSVSLYQTDLRRLDQIKEFMRGRGHRNLSDSEALRLACRAVEIGDRFLNLYKEMQSEDGRRRIEVKA